MVVASFSSKKSVFRSFLLLFAWGSFIFVFPPLCHYVLGSEGVYLLIEDTSCRMGALRENDASRNGAAAFMAREDLDKSNITSNSTSNSNSNININGNSITTSSRSSSSSSSREKVVKLMQFNIRTGFADWGLKTMWQHPLTPFRHSRRAAVSAVVRRHQPDIIATQEGLSWQLRHIAKDLDGEYDYVGGFRGGPSWLTDESSAIFYRKDIWKLKATGDFMLSPTPEVMFSAYPGANIPMLTTWVVLTPSTTSAEEGHQHAPILIVSTHLDPYVPSVRAAQADQLRRTIPELCKAHGCQEAVLLGDFNSDFEEAPWSMLREAGWLDTWAHLHGSYPAGSFTYHAFQGPKYQPEGVEASDPDHAIDFIWLWPANLTVVSSTIDKQRYTAAGPCASETGSGTLPSDHYVLVAEVQLPCCHSSS
eukprot:TRINITY_DN21057_c0_g1_i1.p1 TRINITY_DN21057_c0_g1~~TRINITY_DN21057_c0_g1_i1.p1  ORF type:complete len:421 (+),score=84.07 TRINITY_DN21057_c0_g1_i1:2-1264(+)